MWIEKAFRIGRIQYGPGSTLGPRDTIGYEFVRILKGRVRWTYDDETHDLGPGDFILSQPNHVEHYRWDPQHNTQHDYIHFHLGPLPGGVPAASTWEAVASVEAHDILHSLFQHIVDLRRSGHPAAMRLIKQAVQHMLCVWVYDLHQFSDRGFRDFSPPVQRVLDRVRERWQAQDFKPLSLGAMADASEVSRSSFLRVFKAECAASPSRFFEYQRLQLGELLLLETNRTIDDIAWTLGYANPFHFSRNFKQRFGRSPSAYRQAGPAEQRTADDFTFQRVFNHLSATQTI